MSEKMKKLQLLEDKIDSLLGEYSGEASQANIDPRYPVFSGLADVVRHTAVNGRPEADLE